MAGINLNPITGAIQAGAKAVETVAGVFTTHAENTAQRSTEEQAALLKAYQAEFRALQSRTWADALADAFNRLIRPVIVCIIMSIFVIAYVSPERFAQITLALGAVPNGYWALLSVIVGFYFGGRMQLKRQDFALQQSQVQAVQALIAAKKEFRKLEMDVDEPDRQAGDRVAKSTEVRMARDRQSNMVVSLWRRSEEDERHTLFEQLVPVLASENEERAMKRSRRRVGPRR